MKMRMVLVVSVVLGAIECARAGDTGASAGPPAEAVLPAPPPIPPGGCCAAGCNGCGVDGGQLWVTGEFLVAWFQGTRLAPLVTTSPAGTVQTSAGALGAPGTGGPC